MAQLGFAIAGAAVGAMFGMPQLGWIAGAAIGGLLFPAKGPSTEGPRLGDLSVSSSAYGMPIPIIYGTMRVAGNMIWSSGLREVKKKQKVGGKGGGGGSTTTYTYYASFAVAFGEGPADDVLRIWADSKLIHDKSSTTAATTKAGIKFRFYPGNETQLPDPLIEAHVGVGRVPAHRGLCVIVFEDLALADFGNRIPNITAEITYNRVVQKPWVALNPLDGAALTGFTSAVICPDWTRNVGYLLDHAGDNGDESGIRRFNLITMQEDRQATFNQVVPLEMRSPDMDLGQARWVIACDPAGYLYMQVGGGGTGQRLIRIEPQSLRAVASFGTNTGYPSVVFATTDFGFVSRLAVISAYGLSGREDYLLVGSGYSQLGLLKATSMSYLWGVGVSFSGELTGLVRGQAGEGFGDGWALFSSQWIDHTYCRLYRVRVEPNAFYDPLSGWTTGAEHTLAVALMPSDVVPGATGFYGDCCGLAYDPTDNSVIFQVEIVGSRQVYVLKWREDLGVVWATPVPYKLNWNRSAFDNARIENGRWTVIMLNHIVQVDTATGALVYHEEWPQPVDVHGDQVYDSVTDTLYTWTGTSLVVKAYLGRGGGAGVALPSIVADLCARAGLGEADIDVSELDDLVSGYVIGRQTTVRGAIEPLSQAYFFDGVEIDYQLAFRDRGRASVASIPSTSLVPMSEEETWRERRAQEVDLPERVSVISLNPQMNYQQAVQSEKRIALPTPAMHSRNQMAFELPIALDATTAKRIAAKMLTLAWIERSGYECVLPPPWLRLDPTDVVTVTFPGAAFRSRTVRIDAGADFTLSMKGVADAVAAYTSSVEADAGAGLPAQTITTSVVTFLILPDVPLLRDVDDTGGTGSRVYFAGGGYGEPGWRGAVLYRSVDGSSWTSAGTILEEASYGITLNALGAPAGSPFRTDNDNAIEVVMTTGGDELESMTQEVMLSGTANAALIVKANGEPEIIQFRDVSYDAGAGSYTLTGLLRGRRGTDVFCDGHAVGELFVLLEAETISGTTLELADLDLTRQWCAVSFGSLFEDATIEPRVHTGCDLKPYAPWDVRAALSAGDIVITWHRRTRIGGELKDGTSTVPLAEATEAYEVDILAEPGSMVLRTLESTSESATYGATAIAADFGTTPASLSVVVYQMSAVAGRGFPRAVTLEIA